MRPHGICDLHCHLLPGMDDGCKHVAESMQVLKESYANGVRRMFATPHYYPVESVDAFLHRRAEAWTSLKTALKEEATPVPQICLGAEVAYRPGLGYEDGLDQLCLGNSRYLLLELPFVRWDAGVLREICNLSSSRGVVPIIAHIERYVRLQTRETMNKLLELDVLVQMNASELCHFGRRRESARLLDRDLVQLLGTDCHNMTTRPPQMGGAVAYLHKRKLSHVVDRVASLSNEIFEAATENY